MKSSYNIWFMLKNILIAFIISIVITQTLQGAESLPTDLIDVGIKENIGATLPTALNFTDALGQSKSLQEILATDKPTILNFVYYSCPMLCSLHLDGLADTINLSKLFPGDRYNIITVSFDKNDTVESAKQFKEKYFSKLDQPIPDKSWRFLVGSEESIQSLINATGFSFKYLEDAQEFAHSTALILLTPEAEISRYLYGVMFEPFDFKMGILEASNRKFISTIEQGLLFCYNYDPSSKSYVIHAYRLMQIGCIITVLGILSYIFYLRRQERRTKLNG